MWRSKKFILLAILAALILVGSIAGVVYAQDDGEEDTSPKAVLLEKVADKLGIDSQQLEDAFTEAIAEMRDEAQLRWLEKAVEEGLITEDEAAALSEWWAARPNVDFGLGGLGQRGPLGFGRFRMRGGGGFGFWGEHDAE
jgi:hypothetical protein